jgi:hypothetical protein
MSEAVANIAELRSAAYLAYRRKLGVDGEHLPLHFVEVVDEVVAFADPLIAQIAAADTWDPGRRVWTVG